MLFGATSARAGGTWRAAPAGGGPTARRPGALPGSFLRGKSGAAERVRGPQRRPACHRPSCGGSAVVEKPPPGDAPGAAAPLRTLHPTGRDITSGRLQVSDGHEIFYKVYGNPDASRVALFVHGGPGAGCWPKHARFFDQDKWKVVLVDQRGCGASTPKAQLKGNTTQALVADYEQLRRELGIERWLLLGGSWGVALSLAYAQAHPSRVTGLILRGVCLMRDCEIDWMYRGGVASVYPEAWARFAEHLSEAERADPLVAYYRRLTSEDSSTRSGAASVWGSYEMAVSRAPKAQDVAWDGAQWVGTSQRKDVSSAREGSAPPAAPPASSPVSGVVPSPVSAQALLECHYSINGAFLRGEAALLTNVERVRHLPCVLVQGEMDFVCPMRTALDLKRAWPEADLRLVPGAGHSMYEAGITHELVMAVERMEELC
eukprot:jgi/Tetstr1/463204/TSEL_008136.t1